MPYETYSINQIVGDSTPLYLGLMVLLIIFGIIFAVIVLANHRHRANTRTWYLDQVCAFKAGYIHKKAKEMEIELVYPPKADLMERLEAEVSNDMQTP